MIVDTEVDQRVTVSEPSLHGGSRTVGASRRGWRRRGDDRGAVLVLAAIGMVVLVGFVGFAVDIGMVFNERRQEQSAVDAATLAAGRMFFEDVDQVVTPDDYFDEIIRLSLENMDGSVSEAEWRQRFLECEDPGRVAAGYPFAITVAAGTIDCVSIDRWPTPRAFRVRLPDTTVSTTFASLLGFNEWTVSAFAEAGVAPGRPSSNVIPFSLSSMPAGSTVMCLRTPPNGQATEDCSQGSAQGNFGYLALPRPSWLASNQRCNGGHASTMLQNVGQGIDHNLSTRTGTSVGNYTNARIDDTCAQIAAGLDPNYVFGETGVGNEADIMTTGFVEGTEADFYDGGPSRLQRSPEDWLTLCIRGTSPGCNGERAIDNKPLWEFFVPQTGTFIYGGPGTNAPEVCDPSPTAAIGVLTLAPNDPRVGLAACLSQFADGIEAGENYGPLFNDDILESARFTWLPEAWEDISTSCNGANCNYNIRLFRPVFLQTLYYTNGNRWWGIDPGGASNPDGWRRQCDTCPAQPGPPAKLRGMSGLAIQLELFREEIREAAFLAPPGETRIALIR